MKPLISVIIPIYKVEPYLRKCVDSVLSQTYSDLEIILVDDGSPDNCGKICDEYAEKDSRIKVIHKTNGGVASARNFGLNIAKGDYIGFIDSDDWIEPNMYECLLNDILQNECYISMCEFFLERKKIAIWHIPVDKKTIEADEVIKLSFLNTNFYATWSKLYNKKIFSELRYPENGIAEDMFLFFPIVIKAKKISLIRMPLYHYVFRKNSYTNIDFSEPKYRCYIGVCDELFKETIMQPYLNLLKTHYVNSAWNLLSSMNGYYGGENSVYVEHLLHIICSNKNYIQNISKINFILMKLLAYGFPYKIILFAKNNLRRIKRSFV
jgi:glycosyltransferase involved in cell wall biosynthesis